MDSVNKAITERIIAALEGGVIPWRKTWSSGAPKSLTCKKEYRGINQLGLACAPYASRYWVTFREALRLGGHIRKGEKGSAVIYWHWRTKEEMKALIDAGKAESPAPCVPFVSWVFNLEQTEGLERPADDVPMSDEARVSEADAFLAAIPSKPEIAHGASFEPCYQPSLDRVEMPHLSQFQSSTHYYGVLFHELVHSTGHPARLNRFTEEATLGSAKENYSLEELVAEMGASFLRARAGVESPEALDNTTSYIEGWLKALRSERQMLTRAAYLAQKAVDFLCGKEFVLKEAA